MKKIGYGLVCAALLYINSYADMINPDGRVGHSSFDLSTSWIQQRDIIKYLTPDFETMTFVVKDGEDTFDIRGGELSLNMPVSKYVTLVSKYEYIDYHGMQVLLNFDDEQYYTYKDRQTTISIGINYYSRPVNDIKDLFNPDGVIRSFIVSPVVERILTVENQTNESVALRLGLKLAAIATKHLTVYSSFASSYKFESPSAWADRTVSLGFRYHLNNKAQSGGAFNPNGSPGTVSISPNIGYVTVPDQEYGYTTGAEITMPVIRYVSSYFKIQYSNMKVFDPEIYGGYFYYRYHPSLQKSSRLNASIGVNIHL